MNPLPNVFLNRSRKYESVVRSSFIYLIAAVLVGNTYPMITSFLFLSFLTSFFYHSHPENPYFRIADWLSSIFFLFYIAEFIIQVNFYGTGLLSIFMLVVILAFVSFIISLIAEYLEIADLYIISHIIWHLSSCLGICFVIFTIH